MKEIKVPEMMDVIINGKIEQRKVVHVEMVVGDIYGNLLPGVPTPETFDCEHIIQCLDGTHIVRIKE